MSSPSLEKDWFPPKNILIKPFSNKNSLSPENVKN